MQTASGRAFDLSEPRAALVDFSTDIPEALAKIPRFTGHVRAGAYSVAQHSVIGCDAILRETGFSELAAAFLLHDAHEAYVGDIATPVAMALAERVRRVVAEETGAKALGDRWARLGLADLKYALDAAIHERAGLPWLLPATTAREVKAWDLRMLATERKFLLGPAPQAWHPAVEAALPIRLPAAAQKIWPWPRAADEFRSRLSKLLPAAL